MGFRVFLVTMALLGPAVGLATAGHAEGPVAQVPGQSKAQTPPSITAFSQGLMIGDTLDVMRAEGLKNSTNLADSLFAGENAAAWAALVSLIYDTSKMQARFDQGLAQALGDDRKTLIAAQDFFASGLGQRVLRLEIEARRTLLDDAAETAAKAAWGDMKTSHAARADQIIRFGGINDLIESNVMGALNANLAFYRGLSAQGGFGDPMPEDQMLAEVWGQEPDIRKETTDWLYPFLALAYQPLSDAEVDSYIQFSQTDAGKKINAAIFVAFDGVMLQISTELGTAAGQLMAATDI